ncbi:CoA transferase OS=Streptomyces alboniger OX=132473 GN=CP975_08855 PE=4 SV=1 [Streptomyces alboniger]
MAERPAAECLEAFADAEVVASRVFSVADIADDPVYAEREDIVTVDDADLGPVRMQAVLPHFRQRPGHVWRTGPALGQDNDLVYRDWLGLGEEELAELEKHDVV